MVELPKLIRKKPCNDCPFRRNAAKGWLGEASPRQFLLSTLHEEHMPCHMDIDYSDKDWPETQEPDASFCAGALIFLNNQFKLPRDRELADACREVSRSDDVFARPQEFFEYHLNGPLANEDPEELKGLDVVIGIREPDGLLEG